MGAIYAVLIALGLFSNSSGFDHQNQIQYRFSYNYVQTVSGRDGNYSISSDKIYNSSGRLLYKIDGSTVYDGQGKPTFRVNSSGISESSGGNRYTVSRTSIQRNGQVILNLQ